MVLVLVCLLSAVALLHLNRVQAESKRRQLEERHEVKVISVAKEAHERTIAYACHQLRYGRDARAITSLAWCLCEACDATITEKPPPHHSQHFSNHCISDSDGIAAMLVCMSGTRYTPSLGVHASLWRR
jgi:hypothetical protein